MNLKNFFTDKKMEIYSIIYLVIPYLIFAFGWLKLPIAIILSALLVFSVYLYSKKLDNNENYFEDKKNLKFFLISLSILLIWCLFSGMGGFGYQNNPDWEKNNAIFHDLFLNRWPIFYENYSLIYYMGFYLPIGLIMKLFGWNAGYLFTFVWGFLGLSLMIYWIKRLCGSFSYMVVLLFIFFSGMDVMGLILKHVAFPQIEFMIPAKLHIEWWAGFFQFSSHSTSLFWVPQYAIQGWLLTALIMHNIENRKSSANLLFLWALCSFGVPLVFLTITTIILAGIYITKAKNIFNVQNFVAAPAIVLLITLYFNSKAFKDPFMLTLGYLFNPFFIFGYVLFILLEFLLFAVIIHRYYDKNPLWNITMLSMILLPLIRVGGANELNMRGSLCYLFILFIFIARALFSENNTFVLPKWRKRLLITLLCIGAVTPLLEISRSIILYTAGVPELSKQPGVMDLYYYRNNNQYLGKKDSAFFKYFAKPEK